MEKKRNKKNLNYSIFGIIIGVILGLLLSFIIFMLIKNYNPNTVNITDKNKIVFNNEDVHLNIKNDFELSQIPIYEESYCKKKFFEKYSKETSSCFVSKVKTFTRLNPIVTEVECTCNN